MQIRSKTAIQITVSVEQGKTYVGHVSKLEAKNAFLIGTMFSLMLLAYLFTWATGDRGSLYYALGMTCLGLTFPIMSGYHVWLGLPKQVFIFFSAVMLMANVGMVLLMAYCASFLQLKSTMPRMFRFMWWYGLVTLLSTLVTLVTPFRYSIQLSIITILCSTALMAMVTLVGISRRNRDAWFYFAGNILFWIYMWIQMLFYYGLVSIPVMPETLGQICLSFALLSFFVSMGKRVRLLRYENTRAHDKALRLQERIADELELLVAKRTNELQLAKEDAEAASAAKTAFISQVSHDLRAPLNWLIGLVESLWLESQELNLSKEFTDYLQYIKKGGYYLTQLLNNILDASALEVGVKKVRIAEFDVYEWSTSLECIAHAIAQTSKVDLHWILQVPSEPCLIKSDAARLAQILMNIVHNAIKYSPENKQVQVEIKVRDQRLILHVSDEGEGLPLDNLSLFESYNTGEDKKHLFFHGVGLGLHIVKSNVALLNGRIAVKNLEKGGASFTVLVDIAE